MTTTDATRAGSSPSVRHRPQTASAVAATDGSAPEVGTAPTHSATRFSTAAATASQPARPEPRPTSRRQAVGAGPGQDRHRRRRPAQQCTSGGDRSRRTRAASSTARSPSTTTGSSTARSRPKPLAVGSAPARTAGSDGSSSWTTTCGARNAGAATLRDVPGDPLGEATRRGRGEAPGSTTARSSRGRCSAAASVHGPATWTLNGPAYSSATSARTSRSWRRNGLCAGQVAPRAVDQPPARRAAGRRADRRAARPPRPDEIGAGAPRRQLRQVGHVRRLAELTERRPHRLDDVGARPRADAAGPPGHRLEHPRS